MPVWMKTDIKRLLLVLLASLLVGIVFGQVLIWLFVGCLVVMVWYYRALLGFLDFIKYGTDDNLPDMPGVINELVREFELLRRHYLFREEKLTGFLKRFEEATSALPDAVVVTDQEGKIEWANKKAKEYLGIQWPRDSSQRLSNLIRYPELAAFLNWNRKESQSSTVEIISPVNMDRSLELRINRYGNAYMLFVARDVTEIHRLNRIRKDFIANASHELRTPLTVISGYLESFEDDTESCPEDWRPQIAQMRDQTARMQRLIEDLLALSNLESAEESAPQEEVRVIDLLNAIVTEAKTLSGGQMHVFRTELDAGLLLLGSYRDLYSAFSNIVFNAVQYTPSEGVITVRWYRDDNGTACMQVSDTGEGIEEKHIPRITERFYRVDKSRSRSRGGTGLGLSIVKHALVRHEARLEIKSVPGRGSDFICRFPQDRVLVRPEPSPGFSVTA